MPVSAHIIELLIGGLPVQAMILNKRFQVKIASIYTKLHYQMKEEPSDIFMAVDENKIVIDLLAYSDKHNTNWHFFIVHTPKIDLFGETEVRKEQIFKYSSIYSTLLKQHLRNFTVVRVDPIETIRMCRRLRFNNNLQLDLGSGAVLAAFRYIQRYHYPFFSGVRLPLLILFEGQDKCIRKIYDDQCLVDHGYGTAIEGP